MYFSKTEKETLQRFVNNMELTANYYQIMFDDDNEVMGVVPGPEDEQTVEAMVERLVETKRRVIFLTRAELLKDITITGKEVINKTVTSKAA